VDRLLRNGDALTGQTYHRRDWRELLVIAGLVLAAAVVIWLTGL